MRHDSETFPPNKRNDTLMLIGGNSPCPSQCASISQQTQPCVEIMLKSERRLRLNQRDILVSVGTVLIFCVMGWLYGRSTPLLETPDEPAHFSVVKYMADTGKLPPPATETRTGPAPTVAPGVPTYYVPPLYYAIGALFITDLNTDGFFAAVIPNPNFERGIGINIADGADNKNMYVHTNDQRAPFAGWSIAMQRVRTISLMWGVVTLIGTIMLTHQVWSQEKHWFWRVTAVSLVALNPTFLYLSTGVTNDVLAIALSTWSIVLMVALVMPDRWPTWLSSNRLGILLAILLGLGILTKQTGAILFIPAAVVVIVNGRQQKWSASRTVTQLFFGGLIITLVGGWWYLNNLRLTGDMLALFSHNPLPQFNDFQAHLLFFWQQLWGAFKSYWAAAGWATIFVHPGWYALFVIFIVGSFIGWMTNHASSPSSKRANWIMILAILLNLGILIVWLWRTAAPYGRLLFPVIAPIAVLLVMGWQRLWERWRGTAVLPRLWQVSVIGAMGVLALLMPFRYVQPAFQPLIASADALTQMSPVDAHFNDTYQLLGYRFNHDEITAGDNIDINLFWQLTQHVTSPELPSLFAQIAPLNPERRIAEVGDLLGTSRYPAQFWQMETAVFHPLRVHIPETADAPSLYWLNVGLTDDTGTRQTITQNKSALPNDMLSIGPFRIGAAQIDSPTHPTQYNFSDLITLTGYDIKRSNNGNAVRLTLYWQAPDWLQDDWKVFVHLLDHERNMVTQSDTLPRAGNYPTSWWQPGEIVPDIHLLPLSENKLLETITLNIGLYSSDTGERLPVFDKDGNALLNQAIEIMTTIDSIP